MPPLLLLPHFFADFLDHENVHAYILTKVTAHSSVILLHF